MHASLVGMSPEEVDFPQRDYPHFPGIQTAAIRKARHELGLDLSGSKGEMTFISRFHYWASDVDTHGPNSPWGEHEMDYILLLKLDQEEFDLHLNPEEVASVKYVSMEELKDMMYNSPELKWSPWFVGIVERGGYDWWADLENSLQGKYTNRDITFFDADVSHTATYNLPSHTRTTGVLKASENMSAAERLSSTDPQEWVRIT